MKLQKRGMLKNILLLGIGLVRKNKALTAGMIALFTVSSTLCFTANFSYTTMVASITGFIDEYHMPDALFYTDSLPADFLDDKLPTEVDKVDDGIAMDVHIKDSSGNTTYITLFSIDEGDFRRFNIVESAKIPQNTVPIWVSERFANSNDINLVDTLFLRTPKGEGKCFVEALVSCPETMFCTRNDFSWYDASEYGYVYVRKSDLVNSFNLPDEVNMWAVLFKDGLTGEEEKQAFHKLEKTFGKKMNKSVLVKEYMKELKIEDDMAKVRALGVFLPLILFTIGLSFSCLFIFLIIKKQRVNIGFLMALGYSNSEILAVFMVYSFLTSLTGVLLGSLQGAYFIRLIAQISKNSYTLPQLYYVPDWPKFIISLVFMLSAGMISCVICVRNITKVDPVEAFNPGIYSAQVKVPEIILQTKMESFIKFAVVLMIKNKRRIVITAISVVSCISLMMIGFAYLKSNGAAAPTVFEKRLQYDFLVQYDESKAFCNDVMQLDGVEACESVTAFIGDIAFEEYVESVQINAINKDCKLIALHDIKGNIIIPGDGIILDEMLAQNIKVSVGDTVCVDGSKLKVTGIARQMANGIQYVSKETAERIGHDLSNQVVVKCKEKADQKEVRNAIDALSGFEGIINTTKQRMDMKNSDKTNNALSMVLVVMGFFLGTILINVMVVIGIQENEYNYAILNSLGAKLSSIVRISVVQNGLIYFFSVIIGVPIGIIVCKLVLKSMSSVVKYLPLIEIEFVVLMSCLLTLVYLSIGVIVAIYKAVRIDPAISLKV